MSRNPVWHQVKAPKPWHPKTGEELIGDYLGTQTKFGKFGEYKIHLVRVRGTDIRYASGAVLNDLFSSVEKGMRIKLVYDGRNQARDSDREYKAFSLYTEQEIALKLLETA